MKSFKQYLDEANITKTDILAKELFKVKNKSHPAYKKAHKLMLKDTDSDSQAGLDIMKQFKSSLK